MCTLGNHGKVPLVCKDKNGAFNEDSKAKSRHLRINACACFDLIGGAERDRTVDLLSARQALSQLSYSPILSLWRGLDSMTP